MAKKDLKSIVDRQITDMLDSKEEPSEGRMKLIAIAIKKLALDAKLEESDYGEFFRPDDDLDAARQKPAGGKRANGGGDPA